jgi:hypothetical protein
VSSNKNSFQPFGVAQDKLSAFSVQQKDKIENTKQMLFQNLMTDFMISFPKK